jgi:hypothetical protein
MKRQAIFHKESVIPSRLSLNVENAKQSLSTKPIAMRRLPQEIVSKDCSQSERSGCLEELFDVGDLLRESVGGRDSRKVRGSKSMIAGCEANGSMLMSHPLGLH